MPEAAPDLVAIDLRHHEVMHRLRAEGPVVWVDALDGWVVLSRDGAVAVMRDAVRFTVDDPRFSTAQVVGPSMLSLDGAEHRRHRDPFAAAFLPAVVTPRDGAAIDATARRLVTELQPAGKAELRRQLAGPLAVAVAAGALGLDEVPVAELLGWYDLIVAAVDGVSRGEAVSATGVAAFESLADALRSAAANPSSLLAEVALTLTDDELIANAAVFLFGGIETSEGMTSNLLHHLLADPEQCAMVNADRSLVDAAVEESLRLEPAAARVDRYATADMELEGAPIRDRDLVIVSLAAANRDPQHFPDPDRFDIRRTNVRSHVTFAQGPHACIGAQLARLESRAALNAVLDLLPGIELVGPVETTGVVFRKPRALNATWPATVVR
ncbi:MAG: cytochrome P450 [Ilumatobacteraceae bacterium]|nr:cytochrome P450 [Ilumatobacteraceae bacterium]